MIKISNQHLKPKRFFNLQYQNKIIQTKTTWYQISVFIFTFPDPLSIANFHQFSIAKLTTVEFVSFFLIYHHNFYYNQQLLQIKIYITSQSMTQDVQTSLSLQIVQPDYKINLSNSDDSNILNFTSEKDQENPKDQSSLSFQIEDQLQRKSPNIYPMSVSDLPKRRRKEIFDKYKGPIFQSQGEVPIPEQQENDIMKTFDELFTKSTPRNANKAFQVEESPPLFNEVSRKVFRQKTSILTETKLQPEEQIKINFTPQKCMKKKQQSKCKIESPQKQKKQQNLKSPPQLKKQKENINKDSPQNKPQQQYKLSFIENKQQLQNSNSFSITQILKTQIFGAKDNNLNSDKNLKTEIPKTEIPKTTTESNYMMMPVNTKESKQSIETNMGTSRFSDVYQRIDMSQSIALKDNTHYKYYQPNHFLGNESLGSLKIFSKNSSLNAFDFQQQMTVNELGTNKWIQQSVEDQRVPKFMRNAVKLNSKIPNFSNPQIHSKIAEENKNLQQLVQSFSNVINFLQKLQNVVKQKDKLKKQIMEIFSTGINLKTFKTCNWQKCSLIDGINQCKPRLNLYVRQWDEKKVSKALESYRKIVQNHKGIHLNLRSQKGMAKYFEIRQKYWDIERNILKIADDIYSHVLSLGFPLHFQEFKTILEEEQLILEQHQVRTKKMQIEKIKRLRSKGDQLSLSQVGSFVLSKLTNQMKFNCTHY